MQHSVRPKQCETLSILNPPSCSMQVAFVYGSRLLVNVRALCHGVEKVVTNDFTIAFNSRSVVPEPVMPVSIQEGLAYIQGYRQYHQEQVCCLHGSHTPHLLPVRDVLTM